MRAIRSKSTIALALAVLGLAVARPAPAATIGPVLNLGPTVVANGAATVAGTVGEPMSGLTLSVNGQPLAIDSSGRFSGVVNLAGQSSLDFAVTNPATGEVATTSIPLTSNIVGPGGVISPSVLSALNQAAASITKPVAGFQIQDQLPLTVGGNVANGGELSSLKVNGADVLGQLGPGGAFAAAIPGSSKSFTVLMTDKQGVSHTMTYPITHSSTVIQTPLGPSVAASGALGVRITSVRYLTKLVRSKMRLRIIVTIKDRRGYRIRNATIALRNTQSRFVVGKTRTKRSNKVGQASFIMRVRPRALGKRMFVVTSARTPSAKAQRKTSVRLPRKAQKRAARR